MPEQKKSGNLLKAPRILKGLKTSIKKFEIREMSETILTKISSDTKKSSGDLRRYAVPQIRAKKKDIC